MIVNYTLSIHVWSDAGYNSYRFLKDKGIFESAAAAKPGWHKSIISAPCVVVTLLLSLIYNIVQILYSYSADTHTHTHT